VSDDGSCELKHVALWYVTLQCFIGRWISVVCDIEKHNGMYQNNTILNISCIWTRLCYFLRNRDRIVGAVTGLWTRGSRYRSIPDKTKWFSFLRSVQTDCRAHAASYWLRTECSFPGGKMAEAWSWPFTYIRCRGHENFYSPIHTHIVHNEVCDFICRFYAGFRTSGAMDLV
jgi:hypothetical protein